MKKSPPQSILSLLFLLILCHLSPSYSLFAQNGPLVDTLHVEGEVLKPLRLTGADLAGMKTVQQRAKDKDGKEYEYTGVALSDILERAGAGVGARLKGENLAKYLLVEASDGYQAVFALPELDPAFATRTIFLATLRDGKPLPAGEGAFRIIVPEEKKHARWVRQVVSLKVAFAR